jgi:hypothetical protein
MGSGSSRAINARMVLVCMYLWLQVQFLHYEFPAL